MKGPGGIGKTQVALAYEKKCGDLYDRRFFVDCESSEKSSESLKKIIRELGETPLDIKECPEQLRGLLKKEGKYLLIIDNVDTEETYNDIKDIWPPMSLGHVLITGRCFPEDLKPEPIKIDPFDVERGKELFKSILEQGDDFYLKDDPDLNDFIENTLGNFPLCIAITAKVFKTENIGKSGRKRLTPAVYRTFLNQGIVQNNTFSTLNTDSTGHNRSIFATYSPNIKIIATKFPGKEKQYEIFINEILYFLGFFGMLHEIPIFDDQRDVFFKALESQSGILDHNFTLNKVLEELKAHSVIEFDENSGDPLFIAISQPHKVVIQETFYKAHGHQFNNEDEKYVWFLRAAEYLNAIVTIENMDETRLSMLFSFLDFLEEKECSPSFKMQFINRCKIFHSLIDLMKRDAEKTRDLLNTLPSLSLDKLIEGLVQAIQSPQDPNTKDEIGQALLNLANLYFESDPLTKAQRWIQIAIDAGQKDGYFVLNRLYKNLYAKEKNEAERRKLLRLRLGFCNAQIKIHPFAEAHIDAGECMELLKNDAGAAEHYEKAKELNPYQPDVYEHLSRIYSTLAGEIGLASQLSQKIFGTMTDQKDYKKTSEVYQRIGDGLRKAPPEFKDLPDKYKKVIVAFLESESDFEFAGSGLEDSFDHDGGVIFAQMVGHHPKVISLNLRKCRFNEAGLAALAISLSTNPLIKELMIDWNAQLSNEILLHLVQTAPKQLMTILIGGFTQAKEDQTKKQALGQALIDLGAQHKDSDPTLAKRCLTTAVGLEYQEAYYPAGKFYFDLSEKEGNTKAKQELLHRAVEFLTKDIVCSSNAMNHQIRGVCFTRLKSYEMAATDFETAKSIEPFEVVYHRNLKHVYVEIPGHQAEVEKYQRTTAFLEKPPKTFSSQTRPYKKTILEFLEQKHSFIWNQSKEGQHALNHDGGVIFGQALPYHLGMQTIDLRGFQLSDAGLKAIAEGLKKHSSLRELKLDWNPALSNEAMVNFIKNCPVKLESMEFGNLPQDPTQKQMLGKALMDLGKKYKTSNPRIAMRCFKVAMSLDYGEGYFRSGTFYLNLSAQETDKSKKNKLLKDAIDCFTKRLSIHPYCSASYNRRGACFERLNDLQNALRNYEEARKKDPFNAIYNKNLGRVYSKFPEKDMESRKYKRVGEALEKVPSEFKDLPLGYKKTILTFLESEKIYELKERGFGLGFGNSMWKDGGVFFAENILNKNTSLETVVLYGCDLSDAAVAAIGRSLKKNSCIKNLELGWNNSLKDAGLKALADGLSVNRTIKKLSLVDCDNITYEGIKYLIQKAPINLETIEISSGWFGSSIPDSLKILAQSKGINLVAKSSIFAGL